MASRLHVSTPWITASSFLAEPSVATVWLSTWPKKTLDAVDHGVELGATDHGVDLCNPKCPSPLSAAHAAPPCSLLADASSSLLAALLLSAPCSPGESLPLAPRVPRAHALLPQSDPRLLLQASRAARPRSCGRPWWWAAPPPPPPVSWPGRATPPPPTPSTAPPPPTAVVSLPLLFRWQFRILDNSYN